MHPHHGCTAVRPSFPGHSAHFVPFTRTPHPLVHPTLTTTPIHVPPPTGHPGSPRALCPCPHAALHAPCLHERIPTNHQQPPCIPAMASPRVMAPYRHVPTHFDAPPLSSHPLRSPSASPGPPLTRLGQRQCWQVCLHSAQQCPLPAPVCSSPSAVSTTCSTPSASVPVPPVSCFPLPRLLF